MPPLPLWHYEARKEVLGSLSAIYDQLEQEDRAKLIETILDGPDYADSVVEKLSANTLERAEFLRLSALSKSALEDHPGASKRYRSLLDEHPSWKSLLAEVVTPEAPRVISRSLTRELPAGSTPQEIVDDILKAIEQGSEYFHSLSPLEPSLRVAAISDAAGRSGGVAAIRLLLGIGKADIDKADSRKRLLRVAAALPEEVMKLTCSELAAMLELMAEVVSAEEHEDVLVVLDQVLPWCLQAEDSAQQDGPQDFLTAAINSSSGAATHALLSLLRRLNREHDSGIEPAIGVRLERILRSDEASAIYGRVLIASRLYYLSWLDFSWTCTEVIPKLSWQDRLEATAMWQGYLWNPQMDTRLFEAIRENFVHAFSNVEELGVCAENLSSLLVGHALSAESTMSPEETRTCLRSMGPTAQKRVVWLIAKRLQATESASRGQLWRDRIDEWLQLNWPRERKFADENITDCFGWAATFAGDAFVRAVKTVVSLAKPGTDLLMTLGALLEGGLCTAFPDASLALVNGLVAESAKSHSLYQLGDVLTEIVQAQPQLAKERSYRRLLEIAEQP